MTDVTRRKLLGMSTGALAAAAIGRSAAASPTYPVPNVISRQNAPVELTYYYPWGTPPGQAPAQKKHPATQVIEAFNAQNNGVTINGQTPGGYPEIQQKVQADLAAGNPPALSIMPWSMVFYATKGLGSTDLDTIGGAELANVKKIFKDQALEFVTLENKMVGMPYALSTPVLYYDNDILSQASVDPASLADWESLTSVMGTLQDALNGNPVIALSYNKDWPAQGLIQSHGGRVLDDNNQPAMNKPEAVAAMQTIADLNTKGFYDPGTAQELSANFLGGSTAMLVASIASLSSYRDQASFDLKVASFPAFQGHPRHMSTGGSYMACFAKDATQQQAAWQFMKYASSEEAWKIWMQTGYLNSTNYDIPILEGQEAAYTQLNEGITRETQWPGARGSEIQQTWSTYVERIWAGDLGVQDGLDQAAKELGAMIATS